MKRFFTLFNILALCCLVFVAAGTVWNGVRVYHNGEYREFFQNEFDSIVFSPNTEWTDLTVKETNLSPNVTIREMKSALNTSEVNGEFHEIKNADGSPVVIHGRVISSDREGNFPYSLVLQDETGAIKIGVDNLELWRSLPVGQDVVMDVTGLYYAQGYGEIYSLSTLSTYVDWPDFVKRAGIRGTPAANVKYVGINDEWPADGIYCIEGTCDEISHYSWWHADSYDLSYQLVKVLGVSINGAGEATYAGYLSSSMRYMFSGNGDGIYLDTSGQADFYNEVLPVGEVDVVGINMSQGRRIMVRNPEDITPSDYKWPTGYSLHYKMLGQEYEKQMNPQGNSTFSGRWTTSIEIPDDAVANGNFVEWWITADGHPEIVLGSCWENKVGTQGRLCRYDNSRGAIFSGGNINIEINLAEWTYSLSDLPESLYVVSTSYITFDNAAQLESSPENNFLYKGLAGIESGWGLTGQRSYKSQFYANAPYDTPVIDASGVARGSLMQVTDGQPLNNDNAIPLSGQRGMYYVEANLQALTYSAYKCNTIGITGSMIDWGNGSIPDIAFKNSRTTQYMVWTGTLTLTAGDEWKIRANNEWTVNFGGVDNGSFATDGSPVELAMNGNNFVAAEDGTYNITLYFRRCMEDGKFTPYYMTVVPE